MTELEVIKSLQRIQMGYLSKYESGFQETLNYAIRTIERTNADGCVGCKFADVEEWEMPCAKCKRNSKDYWRAKDER